MRLIETIEAKEKSKLEYEDKKRNTRNAHTKRIPIKRETGPPVITVDYERYAHFLDSSDLTEDQKREFLQALWNIIVEFVSLGFGVHPLQQAKKPCGQFDHYFPKPALTAPDQLYLDDKLLAEHLGITADQLGEGIET